jgi:hypothetical protein
LRFDRSENIHLAASRGVIGCVVEGQRTWVHLDPNVEEALVVTGTTSWDRPFVRRSTVALDQIAAAPGQWSARAVGYPAGSVELGGFSPLATCNMTIAGVTKTVQADAQGVATLPIPELRGRSLSLDIVTEPARHAPR